MTQAAEHIIDRLELEVDKLPDSAGEILQHLIELGYLSLLKINVLLPGEMETALDNFYIDALQSGLFDDQNEDLIYLDRKTKLHAWLRKATDTNNGILLSELPKTGSLNLATRIIHYRLELLGLWPLTMAEKFSQLSHENIAQLTQYANCTALECINLLADIDKFTQRLINQNPPERFVIVFKSPHVESKTKNALDRRHAFKRQLIQDFGERSEFIKYLASEVLKNNPSKVDFHFLQKQANSPFSQFIMRLVQVHQWEEGFYNGLLDSDIGEVTIQSILDSIEFYNESDNKNIKLHRVITSLEGDFFLFNALFFLREYTAENADESAAAAQEGIINKITEELTRAGDDEKNNFDQNFNLLKSEVYSEEKAPPSQRKGLLKRVYYGLKNIVKKAFRFAAKLYQWIIKKISRMWSFLKNLFRNIFENLRLGITAFLEGIKFIAGSRTFETETNGQAVISKFSIDGDSVSVATLKINEVISEHLTKTSFSIKSMKFTMAVVEGVLSIVIRAINIITWPLLLLQIARIYRNVVSSFKELKLLTN